MLNDKLGTSVLSIFLSETTAPKKKKDNTPTFIAGQKIGYETIPQKFAAIFSSSKMKQVHYSTYFSK